MSTRPSTLTYESSELWDNATRHPTSLGCFSCPEYARCGGIHVGASVYDCSDMCRCAAESSCDVVCRCRPDHFVERVREVKGFALDNIPRGSRLGVPSIPSVVPLIDHKYSRKNLYGAPVVALPLYRVIDVGTGRLHASSRAQLSDRFRVSTDARILLSGVDKDRYVEGWWRLSNRAELLAGLKRLGVELVTSPNFSLLSDVPRTDNLHAMKRISLVWSEMIQAGIPAALHINARTDRDYESWTSFIRERDEVTTLAFEFATGCGRLDRIDWHIERLCDLASKVDRPLHLIIRGASHRFDVLRRNYHHVTLLETQSFAKTLRRQRARMTVGGRVKWESHATPEGDSLDKLFIHNAEVVRAALELPRPAQSVLRTVVAQSVRRRASNRDNKSIQPGLLDHMLPPSEARLISFNRDRVVAASKP